MAEVTRRSSVYHEPVVRHDLLIQRKTTMKIARIVKTRDGMRAECARFAVAFCDRTNQLGEFMCILSRYEPSKLGSANRGHFSVRRVGHRVLWSRFQKDTDSYVVTRCLNNPLGACRTPECS